MKRIICLLFLASSTYSLTSAQNDMDLDVSKVELISMEDANVKYGKKYGQQYFVNGSNEPYTGFLSAYYDNGELESVQQYVDGVGNGIWINYDPDGRKNAQGTYLNNKTEGPAILFYEDGSIKAKGEYIHWRKAIGWWTFYDRQGNVVSKRRFTR